MEYEGEERLRAELDARIESLRVMAATIIDSHPAPERALATLERLAAHLATYLADGANSSPIQRARARAFVAELQELKRSLARTRDARAAAARHNRPHQKQDQDHDLER